MILVVSLQPHARETAVLGTLADGTLKVRVQAAADHGKANEALLTCLAKHFSLPRSRVRLVSGETSRRKRVELIGNIHAHV